MILFSGMFGDVNLVKEKKIKKFQGKYHKLLLNGEKVETICRKCEKATKKYLYIFTEKRLILIGIEGIFFRRIESSSISYMRITKFILITEFCSVTVLNIWILGEQKPIALNFNRKNDAYALHDLLSRHVLR